VIADSVHVGIWLFTLACVWGMLFLFKKSPIRSRCWSVSNKLGITIRKDGAYSPKGNRQYLTVYTGMRALSPMRVDRISLCVGRRKIPPFSWKQHEVEIDEFGYVNFNTPSWLPKGEHSARLIVYTPEGYSKSEKFTLTVKD